MDAYPLFPPPPVLDPVDALLGASPGVGAYCGSSDHAVPFIPIGGGDPSAHEDLSRHLSLRQEPSVPSLFTPRQGGGAPSTREAAKESKGAEGVGAPRLRCSHASPAVSLGASPTSEGSLLDLPVERPPAMPVVCLSAAVGPGALSTGAQGREGGGVGVEECALIDMEGFESSAGAKRMEREREDSVADEEVRRFLVFAGR